MSTTRRTAPSSSPSSPPPRGAGFTLAELVLALVILGSLAAVSAPRFFDAGAFDERIFYDETRAAVRYAAKLAVATGCEVRVAVASNGFTLAQRESCTGGSWTQAVVHPGTGASGYAGQAPAGVALTSDVSPFVFDALGRVRTAAGVVTDVELSVGTRSISVVGETGFVDAS